MTKTKKVSLKKKTKSSYNSLISILEGVDSTRKENLVPSFNSTEGIEALPYSILHLERALVTVGESAYDALTTVKSLNVNIDKPIVDISNEEATLILKKLRILFERVLESINTISPNMDLLVFSDLVVSLEKDIENS